MQLNYIHGLRGIAMLFIVFGHALWFQFDWSNNQPTRYFLQDLLSGGTVIFVFVAGFLFEYLAPRFNYWKYMKTKAKNVILPYFIVSTPALLYAFVLGNPAEDHAHLEGQSVFLQLAWYLSVGGAHVNYSLWFIPMICLFFILSPLFYAMVNRPYLYWLIVPLFVLPFIVHRESFPILSPVRAFLYFLPVYIAGMLMSCYRETMEAIVKKYVFVLLAIFIALVFSQYFFGACHGNCATDNAFEFPKGIMDWALVQKMVLSFCVMGLFIRYPKLLVRPLNYVAETSFTTFFFHVYFFFGFYILLGYQNIEGNLHSWFIRGLASLLLCLLVAWLGRKLLGKYSRSVIGS